MENMTELERKFIMMSRIAVELSKKGLHASVDIDPDNSYSHLFVHCMGLGNSVVEHLYSSECTESELLEWWSAIED